jgi:hypothetical protein
VVFGIRLIWDPAGGQRDPNAESVLKLQAKKYLHIEVEDLFTRLKSMLSLLPIEGCVDSDMVW